MNEQSKAWSRLNFNFPFLVVTFKFRYRSEHEMWAAAAPLINLNWDNLADSSVKRQLDGSEESGLFDCDYLSLLLAQAVQLRLTFLKI